MGNVNSIYCRWTLTDFYGFHGGFTMLPKIPFGFFLMADGDDTGRCNNVIRADNNMCEWHSRPQRSVHRVADMANKLVSFMFDRKSRHDERMRLSDAKQHRPLTIEARANRVPYWQAFGLGVLRSLRNLSLTHIRFVRIFSLSSCYWLAVSNWLWAPALVHSYFWHLKFQPNQQVSTRTKFAVSRILLRTHRVADDYMRLFPPLSLSPYVRPLIHFRCLSISTIPFDFSRSSSLLAIVLTRLCQTSAEPRTKTMKRNGKK